MCIYIFFKVIILNDVCLTFGVRNYSDGNIICNSKRTNLFVGERGVHTVTAEGKRTDRKR